MERMRLLTAIISIVLIFSACRDDDDQNTCYDPANPACENYDPCLGKDSVSADFLIEQWAGPGAHDSIKYLAEDSLFYRNILRFRALEEGAAYTWYLGAEKIQDQQFKRDFGPVDYGTTIGVSLVVEKQPENLDCFPNDDGRDSVYREFRIVEVCDLLINNKFKGVFENRPNDSVIVELRAIDPVTGECKPPWAGINLNGKPEPVDTNTVFQEYYSNSFMYFVGTGSGTPKGYLKVNPETYEVYMNYRYYSVDRVFNGRIYQP